jgi:hypothetical protein
MLRWSNLVAAAFASYPTGPSYGMEAGGCASLPGSRWTAGVVSQWREGQSSRPPVSNDEQRSWHGEQMKLYLDMADSRDEGANKYDEYAYVEDTYLELVFDVNIVSTGATFNPFYPIQLEQSFTKWDGSISNQGLWYAEGCCTLHIETDDKESGRDLTEGSEGNSYMEWQWTNHPGTHFTFADHLIDVRMCRHPSTTANGYDTWFNGPSSVISHLQFG